jgi:putative lipoic acid-binding regulatory protein
VDPQFVEGKPLLQYPCSWEYKAIGRDEDLMRQAIAEILLDREHSLTFSRASRTGRYCSMLIEMVIESEEQRLAIYEALREHRHITMVL